MERMNLHLQAIGYPAPVEGGPALQEKPFDLRQILLFLASSWLYVLGGILIFGMLAALYLATTPPAFYASNQLMLQAPSGDASGLAPSRAEDAFVESQIEIIKSDDVLRLVADKLDLRSDPAFSATTAPLLDQVKSDVKDILGLSAETSGSSSSQGEHDALDTVILNKLRDEIGVRRIGQSGVLELSATSDDPRRAAQLANALADAYIEHNVASKSQAAGQLADWLAQRVAELREEVRNADRAVNDFQISGEPGGQYKFGELESVAKSYQELYQRYLTNWSDAKQKMTYPVADAVPISRATVPLSKSRPRTTMVLAFGAVVGALAGVSVALVRRVLDPTVRSIEDIAARAGARGLGSVSHASLFEPRYEDIPVVEWGDTTRGSRTFGTDIRALGATVAEWRRQQGKLIVGVVSADASAGATTIAFNLARLASVAGSKVALIDAAASNPTLSRTCARPEAPGLTDALAGPKGYETVLPDASVKLTIIPIGSRADITPGEWLAFGHSSFKLQDLKNHFDIVIVDLPSLSDSADARLLAPHTDGVVVVARQRSSRVEAVREAVKAMNDVGATLFGVLLNDKRA